MIIEKSGALWNFCLGHGDLLKSCEQSLDQDEEQNDPLPATEPGQSSTFSVLWTWAFILLPVCSMFDWIRCLVRKHENLGHQRVLNSGCQHCWGARCFMR